MAKKNKTTDETKTPELETEGQEDTSETLELTPTEPETTPSAESDTSTEPTPDESPAEPEQTPEEVKVVVPPPVVPVISPDDIVLPLEQAAKMMIDGYQPAWLNSLKSYAIHHGLKDTAKKHQWRAMFARWGARFLPNS